MAVWPCCGGDDRIGIHSCPDQRCRCHDCGRTFSETKDTPLYHHKCPLWFVMVAFDSSFPRLPRQGHRGRLQNRRANGHGLASESRPPRQGHSGKTGSATGTLNWNRFKPTNCALLRKLAISGWRPPCRFAPACFLGRSFRGQGQILDIKVDKKVWQAGRNHVHQGVLLAVDGFSAYVNFGRFHEINNHTAIDFNL